MSNPELATAHDVRMPRDLHEALCNGLAYQLAGPMACDHTHTVTKRVLACLGVSDARPAVAWLRERGGYCDCEVLFNTTDLLADTTTPVDDDLPF
jgi:hypothetical protein